MKRTDDSNRANAEMNNDRARLQLEILKKGICHTLEVAYDLDEVALIIDVVNGPLLAAVNACQVAAVAYEPYRRRRSVRVFRVANKKFAKKKTAPKV